MSLNFLKAIHDAEDDLVKAQLELGKVRDRLQQARLDLREKIAESASKCNVCANNTNGVVEKILFQCVHIKKK